MRLYHQYYRQKNPGRRQVSLRGEKRELHGVFMKTLENPGRKRRKNPKHKAGQAIDAFNLLAELNTLIDEGHTGFIPLRDTVAARIEGYLDEGALNYTLSEALRGLSKAEVRVIREMIDDVGGEATPEEGREIRRQAQRHPTVQRARARVVAAEQADEAFRKSLARGRLSDTEFIVGPERLTEMKAQQSGARAEVGEDIYRPADKKLWKRIGRALEEKFPHKFIPARVKSRRMEEFALLVKMSHKETPSAESRKIKRRLQTAIVNRWKTALILSYEKAGGKELTREQIKLREAQRMRKLGVPFPLGPGFFGVINKAKSGSGCRWDLLDQEGFIYISGTSGAKSSASREVAIAYRVVVNLAVLGEEAGWDNLAANDRRWLEDKTPQLSKRVARILLQHINKRRKVSKSTAKWLVSAADVKKYKVEEEKDVAQSCRNMTLGEERIFPGPKGAYHIHVRKAARGKFVFFVETKEGKVSQKRRTDKCDEVLRKGHLVGGAMTGALEVMKAISNPAKIKRLHNSAVRYFRKKNPKLPRQAADEGDIRELTGMIGVPDNSDDAYRYGFYAGIIRGIDTCGVQNYFKRRRIRNEFQERLLSAAMETTARVTGTRSGSRSTGKRKKSAVDDVDEYLASILADVGD